MIERVLNRYWRVERAGTRRSKQKLYLPLFSTREGKKKVIVAQGWGEIILMGPYQLEILCDCGSQGKAYQ